MNGAGRERSHADGNILGHRHAFPLAYFSATLNDIGLLASLHVPSLRHA